MRYRAVISYFGAHYAGWQRQKNALSVQEILEKAMTSVFGAQTQATASGRTDAGVHAEGQVIHFDADTSIPCEKIPFAINAKLPPDISVLSCELVPDDFNARFSAKRKTYCYKLYLSKHPRPMLEYTHARIVRPLDLSAMREAARYIVGTHDFKCFEASGSKVQSTIRTVYRLKIDVKALDSEKNGNLSIFSAQANHISEAEESHNVPLSAEGSYNNVSLHPLAEKSHISFRPLAEESHNIQSSFRPQGEFNSPQSFRPPAEESPKEEHTLLMGSLDCARDDDETYIAGVTTSGDLGIYHAGDSTSDDVGKYPANGVIPTIALLREAEGYHINDMSFRPSAEEFPDPERIFDCEVLISVTGNGFLYNMVRIIAGTLVYVGLGKLSPDDVKNIIDSRERKLAGKTLPPQGLHLISVEY